MQKMKRIKTNKKGGKAMYFESKDKGGVESEKVKVDKENQEKRLKEYAEKFRGIRAGKTKGGNN